MNTAAPVRLTCPACGRQNEPERIYCHDCGTRLDHSTLPRREQVSTETPEQTHQRVNEMFHGRRGLGRALALKWAKLVGAAMAAAAVILVLLPPDLPPAKKAETLPPQINLDLEAMVQYHRPPALRYSEEEVNAYLAYVLGKKENLHHPMLHFERALVLFHPGHAQLVLGRSILGYTLYTSGLYAVELQHGKLSATASGGAIGRLGIHPALMRYGDFLFRDFISALERERKLLVRAGSIELREKEVVLAAQ